MGKVIRWVLGPPIATSALRQERLSNHWALGVLVVDALSSVAYATEEILIVLISVSLFSLWASIPIALAITALSFLVCFSYRQVVVIYPQGGGVYSVAKENLGENFSLVGAASLMVDYGLTVGVSIAAGVAALTSAVPLFYPYRVLLGLLVIIILTIGNLRGVRESAFIFSLPTFLFIAAFGGMFLYGAGMILSGSFPAAEFSPSARHYDEMGGTLGILLIFRAFSSGCTALTGIEAVSNGVQVFKPPESENASKTLVRMPSILGALFLGITFFAYYGGIIPKGSEETVVSQVARAIFGASPFYYLVQGATMMVLFLAANTSYAGFPQVASRLAGDDYLPHQFKDLGSKGVYTLGIFFLSIFGFLLLVMFDADTHALIPLYAVGVFVGFSISQLGMVVYWKRRGIREHLGPILTNALGCGATTLVFGITFFFKFTHGAWMLLPVIFFIVYKMKKAKKHYRMMEEKLKITGNARPKVSRRKTVIVPISHIQMDTLHALDVAVSLNPGHISALYIGSDRDLEKALRKEWEKQQELGVIPHHIKLHTILNEYREIQAPILEYLSEVQKKCESDTLYVVIPDVTPPKTLQYFLHHLTPSLLKLRIDNDRKIDAVVVSVSYKVYEDNHAPPDATVA